MCEKEKTMCEKETPITPFTSLCVAVFVMAVLNLILFITIFGMAMGSKDKLAQLQHDFDQFKCQTEPLSVGQKAFYVDGDPLVVIGYENGLSMTYTLIFTTGTRAGHSPMLTEAQTLEGLKNTMVSRYMYWECK